MMMKTGVLAFCLCAAAAPALAQQMQWTDRGFVTVNIGVQVGSHNLNSTQTFTIYEEAGSISSSQKVKSGVFFDVGGAYKVWRNNILAGLTYSRTSSDSNISLQASVPDPFHFDEPRTVTASASGAKHTESALHFDAIYMLPVTDKIDVGLFLGPTIFFARQDLVSSLAVTETGQGQPPLAQPPAFTRESRTTGGFNLGVDVQYLLGKSPLGHLTKKFANKTWGVGGTARFAWGSARFANTSKSLTLGGLQLGVGARFRF